MSTIALPEAMLDQCPLCPLDDRYTAETRELRAYFTTPALVKTRLFVQVRYLIALSDEPQFTALPPLPEATRFALMTACQQFGSDGYQAIRLLEEGDATRQISGLRHDVKAGEYWLQQFLRQHDLGHLVLP